MTHPQAATPELLAEREDAMRLLQEHATATGQYGRLNFASDQWNPWLVAVDAMLAFARHRIASASAPAGLSRERVAGVLAGACPNLWGQSFEDAVDAILSLTAAPQPPVVETLDGRACTCDPADRPIECQRRFGATDCQFAALATQPADERMREAAAEVAENFEGSAALERADDPCVAVGQEIAAAIRALPLTKEPRDDR